MHFLDSIGVPVLRGRGFTEQDTPTSQSVVLVNQAFAQHFFPNQDPIGKHFGLGSQQYSGAFEIVGVFADFKLTSPRDEVQPVFLRLQGQAYTGYTKPEDIAGESSSMFVNSILLDFNRPQQDAEAMARKTLAAIDPNLTVVRFNTLDFQVAGNFSQERLVARLTSLFGILALILASVGLYGVMSYFVARRTGEIGIRMALGATRQSVVSMVLRGALWQILIGLALGIPSALSQLYDVGSYDPLSLAGATIILALCAAAAGFIPARRAASIEPMQALRTE
jgi:ABC-type antimicrobial peptide transport system permease subunit